MTKPDIKSLTPKIKHSKAWKMAEDEYLFLYENTKLPPQLRFIKPLTNFEIIDRLKQIMKDCPSYYPAYLDLGARLLSVDINLATETLDTAFEICIKISSWETIFKDYNIVFNNFEKIYHEEFLVRYALKLIEKFPLKTILYDYASGGFNTLNENTKAIEYARKAVNLEPNNTNFLNNLGVCYLSNNNLVDAEKYFNLSLKSDIKNENAKNNLANCKAIKESKISLKEYYLLPVDYKKIEKLEEDEEDAELEKYIHDMNWLKLLVLTMTLSKENQFKVHNYHSLISTLKIFFNFVNQISNEYFIWEDINLFRINFKSIMHKFIFKHGDVDDEIFTEIYESTYLYYNFLSENNVIEPIQFTEFKEYANSLKDELSDKMHIYNKIRHDPKVSEKEKEKIRNEIFEGDHEWMFL